jgi:hypothetical protein
MQEKEIKELQFKIVEELKKEEQKLPMFNDTSIYEIIDLIITKRITFKNGVKIYVNTSEKTLQLECDSLYINGETIVNLVNKFFKEKYNKETNENYYNYQDIHIEIVKYLSKKREIKNKYNNIFNEAKNSLKEHNVKFEEIYNSHEKVCERLIINNILRILYNKERDCLYIKFQLNFKAHEAGYLVKSFNKMLKKIGIVTPAG